VHRRSPVKGAEDQIDPWYLHSGCQTLARPDGWKSLEISGPNRSLARTACRHYGTAAIRAAGSGASRRTFSGTSALRRGRSFRLCCVLRFRLTMRRSVRMAAVVPGILLGGAQLFLCVESVSGRRQSRFLPDSIRNRSEKAARGPCAAPTNDRLPPLTRDLEIDYIALSLVAPEKVRFKYRLEGQDHGWREVINDRQVRHSNLPPGP